MSARKICASHRPHIETEHISEPFLGQYARTAHEMGLSILFMLSDLQLYCYPTLQGSQLIALLTSNSVVPRSGYNSGPVCVRFVLNAMAHKHSDSIIETDLARYGFLVLNPAGIISSIRRKKGVMDAQLRECGGDERHASYAAAVAGAHGLAFTVKEISSQMRNHGSKRAPSTRTDMIRLSLITNGVDLEDHNTGPPWDDRVSNFVKAGFYNGMTIHGIWARMYIHGYDYEEQTVRTWLRFQGNFDPY